MTTLLLGGTGKTSTRLSALLTTAQKPHLLTSRHPPSPAFLKFDWINESTWAPALEHTPINAIYMMEPQVASPWVPMIKFVDLARTKGVKRFVLCAGTSAALGRDGMGRVWEHFVEVRVEYCVLRPSWFMENLLDPGPLHTITHQNAIYTATQNGLIPFISADDIATVAYHALTDAKSPNCDLRLLGPKLLTYDAITTTLSHALNRPIQHIKLDEASRISSFIQAGVSDYYARFITRLEVLASQDFEKATGDAVQKMTGRAPKTFGQFVEENRGAWKV